MTKHNRNLFLNTLAVSSIVAWIITIVQITLKLMGRQPLIIFGIEPGEILIRISLIVFGLSLLILANAKEFFKFPKQGISSREILQVVSIVIGGIAMLIGILAFFQTDIISPMATDLTVLVIAAISAIILGLQFFARRG